MRYLLPALAGFLITSSQPTTAQTTPQAPTFYDKVSIVSPTAASLGKYGDIPVGYHTGIPQISVPLYTIKEGPLSLPISLSYHGGGGIKVGEPASWVGTGWALNAGGVITRTIIGAPDESNTSKCEYGHFSDYGYSSYWTQGGSTGYTTNGVAPFDYKFANNLYDGEPDLFFFNFNGYTGKFYFSDDRTPVLVEGQDLKIEYYYPRDTRTPGPGTGEENNIFGFIITVPSGDKYYFGITDNQPLAGVKPVEMSYATTNASPNNDNLTYTSWYLTKIVAADKIHTINFSYQPEGYSVFSVAMFPSEAHLFQPAGLNGPIDVNAPWSCEFSLTQTHITGVRLAGITFSNGRVDFAPSSTPRQDLNGYGFANPPNTEAKALQRVVVSAADLCKQFDFSYSYFSGDNSPLAYKLDGLQPGATTVVDSDKLRLKLDKVQEKSCDSTARSGPWVFTYYSNFLPRRLSFAQDHWGYYNGQDYNNQLWSADDHQGTLIPTLNLDPMTPAAITVPGANRDAAWPAPANGLLTGIQYPTGGSSTFEYEGNDIWVSYIDNNATTLVKEIDGGDGVGNPMPLPVTLQLSNNPYLFKLDVHPDPSSPGGSAGLNGPGINGLSTGFGLHTQQLVRPGSGPAQYTLWVNNLGHTGFAAAQIFEVAPQTVERNTLAGGGRIKTITTKALAGAPDVVTTYSYRANGKSTGTLFSRPRYVQVVRNDWIAKWGFEGLGDDGSTQQDETKGCMGPDNGGQMYLKSPCGIVPMATTQGNHLGYDQVTVAQAGNGHTDYYYYGSSYGKSYDDVCYRTAVTKPCDPTMPSLPAVPVPYDFNRGQLKYAWSFNEAGQLLKDLRYSYTYDSTKTVTPAYMVRYVSGAMLGAFYQRRGYWRKQMQVFEGLLDPAGNMQQTTKIYDYNSPYHRELARVRESVTAGDTLETRHTYTADLVVPMCDAIPDGTATYQAGCNSCTAAFYNQLSRSTTVAQRRMAEKDREVCFANARVAYINYRRQRFTNPSNQYQTLHDQAKQGADNLLRPVLQLQDDFHNEPVETSHWKNHQLLSATYNTYGPGLTEPTVIYPAQQFMLPATAPIANFNSLILNGNSLYMDPRYATIPEVTLKFSQGSLVEMAPRTAPVEAYLWGYNNTLPIASVKGINYSTLSGAYSAAGNDLTRLRVTPSLAKALVSTYVYKPLLGITSQTDPAGRTTTYEYDALGRLVRTRDEQGHILSQQRYHYAGQKP